MRKLLQLLQYPADSNCFTETTGPLPLNRCSHFYIHNLFTPKWVWCLLCTTYGSRVCTQWHSQDVFLICNYREYKVFLISWKVSVGFRRVAKWAEILGYLDYSLHKGDFVEQIYKSFVNQVGSYNGNVYYSTTTIDINIEQLILLLKN